MGAEGSLKVSFFVGLNSIIYAIGVRNIIFLRKSKKNKCSKKIFENSRHAILGTHQLPPILFLNIFLPTRQRVHVLQIFAFLDHFFIFKISKFGIQKLV